MSDQLSINLSNESPGIWLGDTLLYAPQPKQLEFHTASEKYVLFGGARGGGKTCAAIWEAIITCLTIPGCDVLILRRTFPQLRKTVINEFLKIPHEVYSSNQNAYNRSSNVVNFDNGSHLWFGSCASEDAVRQYLGSQFVLILVEEFSEFTFTIFEHLKGANRCPIKVDINGDPVYPCMKFTTNPGGVGHQFIKNLFMDRKPAPGQGPSTYTAKDYRFIRSLVYDNKIYAEDENYLNTLRSLSPTLRKAYLDGSWDIFEGQYFGNFDVARSIITPDEALLFMTKQSWQPRWISIDWGYEHWAAVLWFTPIEIYDEQGQKQTHTLTYREFVTNHLGEAALAQEIVRLTNGEKIERVYLSPECFGDDKTRNSRAKLIGDVLVANGLPRPVRADNDRVGGWRLMHEMLGGTSPRSEWLISEACTDLVESLPLLIRDAPNRIEDVKKTDAKSDDVGDSARYGIKSHLAPGDKPREVRLVEVLAPYGADLSAMHMAHLQFLELEKNNPKSKPFFVKGRRRR